MEDSTFIEPRQDVIYVFQSLLVQPSDLVSILSLHGR